MDQRPLLPRKIRPPRLQSRHQRSHLRDEPLVAVAFICLLKAFSSFCIRWSIGVSREFDIHPLIADTNNSLRIANEKPSLFLTTQATVASESLSSACNSAFHFCTYCNRSTSPGSSNSTSDRNGSADRESPCRASPHGSSSPAPRHHYSAET